MGNVIDFGAAKLKSDYEKRLKELSKLMIIYHRENKVDTFEYDMLLNDLFNLGLNEEEVFELMIYSEFNK